MRDTIDMAETISHGWWLDDEKLKAFEAFVRADEREQALATPVQPVAWMHTSGHIQIFHPHWEQVAVDGYTREKGWTPLYTTPPAAQRQWVGLTDEEVGDLSDFAYANDEEFVRNVEAKLKEKNT